MVFTSLPKSSGVSFYISYQLGVKWKINFPDQRTVSKDPHVVNLKMRSKLLNLAAISIFVNSNTLQTTSSNELKLKLTIPPRPPT